MYEPEACTPGPSRTRAVVFGVAAGRTCNGRRERQLRRHITTDTKLANDLTACPGDGIVIGADNITLDLNGHMIDGDGLPSSFEEACPGGRASAKLLNSGLTWPNARVLALAPLGW